MIKIRIAGLNHDIEFEEEYVNILEIENKTFFLKIVNTLNNLINNKEENNNLLLLEDDKELPLSKDGMILFDIFNIDFNEKKILNKVYAKITEYIKLDSSIEEEYLIIINNLKNYIIDKINDLPFEYTIKENINIEDVLKIFSIKLDEESYITLIEKVEFLIDLISIFKLVKVLILVNIKDYFLDEELVEIYKYAKYKKINLLLIEKGRNEKKLKYEKKIYIDEEYDDFIY